MESDVVITTFIRTSICCTTQRLFSFPKIYYFTFVETIFKCCLFEEKNYFAFDYVKRLLSQFPTSRNISRGAEQLLFKQ